MLSNEEIFSYNSVAFHEIENIIRFEFFIPFKQKNKYFSHFSDINVLRKYSLWEIKPLLKRKESKLSNRSSYLLVVEYIFLCTATVPIIDPFCEHKQCH